MLTNLYTYLQSDVPGWAYPISYASEQLTHWYRKILISRSNEASYLTCTGLSQIWPEFSCSELAMNKRHLLFSKFLKTLIAIWTMSSIRWLFAYGKFKAFMSDQELFHQFIQILLNNAYISCYFLSYLPFLVEVLVQPLGNVNISQLPGNFRGCLSFNVWYLEVVGMWFPQMLSSWTQDILCFKTRIRRWLLAPNVRKIWQIYLAQTDKTNVIIPSLSESQGNWYVPSEQLEIMQPQR